MSIYLSHWGLSDTPFRDCHDPRQFYQSPTHDEALARLHFLVDERRRLGLLMGPAGSGKSLLLEVFGRQVAKSGAALAAANLVGLEPQELLWKLVLGFGLNPARAETTIHLWRRLSDRLAEFRYQDTPAVVLLDDADQASPAVLAHVARLAQFDRTPDARLTIVLAGREDRMGRIGPSLMDLAELRIDLEPWEEGDTQQYLRWSLAQAGCDSEVFADAAIARLHELSHGIPRRVSQLADLSLLAGAGRQLPQIDPEVVESVYHELGVGP